MTHKCKHLIKDGTCYFDWEKCVHKNPKKECCRYEVDEPMAEKKFNFEKTNRVCQCGRKIFKTDTYYIRIEPGENIETFCDFCITLH